MNMRGDGFLWRRQWLSLLGGLILLILAVVPPFADPPSSPRTNVALEALRRLAGMDLDQNPQLKAAVARTLRATQGTADFVEIVRLFHLTDQDPALLELAVQNPASEAGVAAMHLLLEHDAVDLLQRALQGTNALRAANTAAALGNTAQRRAVPLLEGVLTHGGLAPQVRKAAVVGLAQTTEGARAVLKLAQDGALGEDVKLTATRELSGVRWPQIRAEAAKVLPLPQTAQAQPLPPVSVLLRMNGQPERGAAVFARATSACTQCHRIRDQGVDFAPNLSEIGSKLGKDALYEAILQPSAGIAVGYEGTAIELQSGDEAYGIVTSETADEVVVKSKGGVITHLRKSEIVSRQRLKTSIMPEGLQQTMSVQDLVDLVEFLASLKQAGPASFSQR